MSARPPLQSASQAPLVSLASEETFSDSLRPAFQPCVLLSAFPGATKPFSFAQGVERTSHTLHRVPDAQVLRVFWFSCGHTTPAQASPALLVNAEAPAKKKSKQADGEEPTPSK